MEKQGIYRSDDAGGSWTLVHADREIGKLHVNPWAPERMIVSYNAKGRQLKVSIDGGASFAEPDTVNTGPGGHDDGVISEVSCLVVWHPRNPDRIWAHGGPRHWQSDNGGRDWRPANGYFNGKQHHWDGVPNKFFRTVDGGRTWENLSEGFPGVFVRGLEVSPTTGDVFTGSSNGSRVLPPPYREEGAARSAAATSVWGQRYLDRPY